MARYNSNRYQYETSPRKLQPDYEPVKKKYPKKTTNKAKKIKQKKQIKNNNSRIVLVIGVVFIILFAMSYRNGLISQRYSELKKLKSELSEVEKNNKQLEVNIESKTNLGAIEEKASKELGLKKLDESKKVYVSLDKQDYIESSADELKIEKDKNWLELIIDKVKNIF